MNGWAWFTIIWFGTIMLMFALGLAKDVARSRWGLSDQATDQVRQAVRDGVDAALFDADVELEGPLGRDDTLPLKFKDLDDLSDQL